MFVGCIFRQALRVLSRCVFRTSSWVLDIHCLYLITIWIWNTLPILSKTGLVFISFSSISLLQLLPKMKLPHHIWLKYEFWENYFLLLLYLLPSWLGCFDNYIFDFFFFFYASCFVCFSLISLFSFHSFFMPYDLLLSFLFLYFPSILFYLFSFLFSPCILISWRIKHAIVWRFAAFVQDNKKVGEGKKVERKLEKKESSTPKDTKLLCAH